MSQIRNKLLTIRMGPCGIPLSVHINGIGDSWIDLSNSQVKFLIDKIPHGPISFSENADRIIFMLNCIAKEKNGTTYAYAIMTGLIGKSSINPLALFVDEIKLNCTSEQLLGGLNEMF